MVAVRRLVVAPNFSLKAAFDKMPGQRGRAQPKPKAKSKGRGGRGRDSRAAGRSRSPSAGMTPPGLLQPGAPVFASAAPSSSAEHVMSSLAQDPDAPSVGSSCTGDLSDHTVGLSEIETGLGDSDGVEETLPPIDSRGAFRARFSPTWARAPPTCAHGPFAGRLTQ